MAEVATKTGQIDLLNIEGLVSASDIAELTKLRNCLVHNMSGRDIVRVVWELVSQLPMMQMHRMYSTEEIFKLASLRQQKVGRDVLNPLKDGKQKMILCPVYLPLKRKPPGKHSWLPEVKHMEPLSSRENLTDRGVLERIILVDRDGCFHTLDGFWDTMDEYSSRPHYEYHGYRQLHEVTLRQLEDADELHRTLCREDTVRFFYLAIRFLEEALRATLESVRREFEKTVGIDGEGDKKKREKYLIIVRATNLFNQVRRQVQHRYGC